MPIISSCLLREWCNCNCNKHAPCQARYLRRFNCKHSPITTSSENVYGILSAADARKLASKGLLAGRNTYAVKDEDLEPNSDIWDESDKTSNYEAVVDAYGLASATHSSLSLVVSNSCNAQCDCSLWIGLLKPVRCPSDETRTAY